MKCPCKGCNDRTITCHSVCRPYQEYKADRERIIAERTREVQGKPLSHDLEMKYRRKLKQRRV